MLELIVDNAFFCLGNKVYRQIIGIPMGIDPAPQMANLYLHFYEEDFMKKLTRENYAHAKKFNLTKRFIDDLNTFNNDGLLHKYYTEGRIYPEEMVLNKENQVNTEGTFLDLDMKIQDKVINVKLYDKREAFSFEIVNYPHMDSNIPRRIAYGVFGSQLIRFSRICTDKAELLKRIKLLIAKLTRKGYKLCELKKTAMRMMERHIWILELVSHEEITKLF